MDATYRSSLAGLLAHAYPALPTTHSLEFKNVFGAVGGYVNGRIFSSYGTFGFALRLPPAILSALFSEATAKPLKYFPNGHVKKEYGVLSPAILKDAPRLSTLVRESIAYTLPSSPPAESP